VFEPTCAIVGAGANLAGAIKNRFTSEGFAVVDVSRQQPGGPVECDVLIYHVDPGADVGAISAFTRPILDAMRTTGRGAVLFGGSAAQVALRALIDSLVKEYEASGIWIRMVALDELASVSAVVADLYWRLFFSPEGEER
jgi:hypothetical protein